MKVLGIETSCDETGIAIYDEEKGLLINKIHSQVSLHATYGGVVPELASRDHVRKIAPLLAQTLAEADLSPRDLDGVAYTAGPGLMGALLVGATFGRSLAYALNIPAIAIHHLEGHLLAPFLEASKPQFPFLALLVSGGHSQIVQVESEKPYQILGDTLDDAAGEAFDKTAKLLGLGYPGGAALATLAKRGKPKRFKFPRPLLDRKGYDFSFSGLKTHARNVIQKEMLDEQTKADIALAFEEAIVETLVHKCRQALLDTHLKQLVIAGGVAANLSLRHGLKEMSSGLGIDCFFPALDLCSDNGAMIAYAGYRRLQQGQRSDLAIIVNPRWRLEDIIVP